MAWFQLQMSWGSKVTIWKNFTIHSNNEIYQWSAQKCVGIKQTLLLIVTVTLPVGQRPHRTGREPDSTRSSLPKVTRLTCHVVTSKPRTSSSEAAVPSFMWNRLRGEVSLTRVSLEAMESFKFLASALRGKKIWDRTWEPGITRSHGQK